MKTQTVRILLTVVILLFCDTSAQSECCNVASEQTDCQQNYEQPQYICQHNQDIQQQCSCQEVVNNCDQQQQDECQPISDQQSDYVESNCQCQNQCPYLQNQYPNCCLRQKPIVYIPHPVYYDMKPNYYVTPSKPTAPPKKEPMRPIPAIFCEFFTPEGEFIPRD